MYLRFHKEIKLRMERRINKNNDYNFDENTKQQNQEAKTTKNKNKNPISTKKPKTQPHLGIA